MHKSVAEQIAVRNEIWKDAAARHDLDGMMSIYAPDATEMLPGMPPTEGKDAIRAFYEQLLESMPRFENEFDPVDIIVSDSEDVAVARGFFKFTPDSEHPEEFSSGKYVGVWQKLQGSWYLKINISNGSG